MTIKELISSLRGFPSSAEILSSKGKPIRGIEVVVTTVRRDGVLEGTIHRDIYKVVD